MSFQTKHALQYGLSITAHDLGSSEVVAVRCQFCVCFGHEVISKKQSTTWTFEGPPFRTDNSTKLVMKFHDRLLASWNQNAIDLIVDQHKKLLNVVIKEPRLQTALAHHSEQTDFSEAWRTPSIKDRFPELMEFCGGLASPFPNTAIVESDFFVLKWEKDLHRSNLTPFSLEGIIHCRQIRTLLKIQQ